MSFELLKNYRSHKDIVRAARNILKKKNDEEGSMDQEPSTDFFDQDDINEKDRYGIDDDDVGYTVTHDRSIDYLMDVDRVEDKYKREMKERDNDLGKLPEMEKERKREREREREELARTVEGEPTVQVVASYSTEDQAEYIAHMVHYLISSRQV